MKKKYRIAAAVPKLKPGDVPYNTAEIIRLTKEAEKNGAELILFPELAVTGATCGDLFRMPDLQNAADQALKQIKSSLRGKKITVVAGVPYDSPSWYKSFSDYLKRKQSGEEIYATFTDPGLCNCMAVIRGRGEYALITKETLSPEEERWFKPERALDGYQDGAVMLYPAADPAGIGKAEQRKDYFSEADGVSVFASAGIDESTTDRVYDGHAMIWENGKLLAESKRFCRESQIIYGDIKQAPAEFGIRFTAPFDMEYDAVDETLPFIPEDREKDCEEIFNIQVTGLLRRLEASYSKKAVIGISGGLDSTLAILVAAEAVKRLGWTPDRLVAITMPGFGTTNRTKSNSEKLSELLGCNLRTVDITKACLQHFKDIGHDPADLSVTYQNVQARERTQILMDTANREGGIVVGTGDLSEIALGWSTYNGDHMSMYNVNCSIPKTLVRVMTDWYADKAGGRIGRILKDVLATPISPELLPADKDGRIAQETENLLGPYELHDFFLYRFIRFQRTVEEIFECACDAFADKYPPSEILRVMEIFFKRFFSQQFKRSCSADGPQATRISLSPRGSWNMPSDAAATIWLAEIRKLKARLEKQK